MNSPCILSLTVILKISIKTKNSHSLWEMGGWNSLAKMSSKEKHGSKWTKPTCSVVWAIRKENTLCLFVPGWRSAPKIITGVFNLLLGMRTRHPTPLLSPSTVPSSLLPLNSQSLAVHESLCHFIQPPKCVLITTLPLHVLCISLRKVVQGQFYVF